MYNKEALQQIETKLGRKIRDEKLPMKNKDHLEEDESPLLNSEQHKFYQSLLGMLQWTVSIGRLDICYAVSLLSHFCSCPRQGHQERLIKMGISEKIPKQVYQN
jgi:hypothetical protein